MHQDDPFNAGEFGSDDLNPNVAQSPASLHGCQDTTMVDFEGSQRPSDDYIPNPINEPIHDAHVDVELGQGYDTHPLQEQVVHLVRKRWGSRDGEGFHNVETWLGQGNILRPKFPRSLSSWRGCVPLARRNCPLSNSYNHQFPPVLTPFIPRHRPSAPQCATILKFWHRITDFVDLHLG